MLAIEPVRFTTSRVESRPPIRRVRSSTDRPGYFFDKIIAESGKYEAVAIRESVVSNLRDTLIQENKRLSAALSEVIADPSLLKDLELPIDEFLSYTNDIALSRVRGPQRIYIRTQPPKTVIVRMGTGSFVIVANSKEEALRVVDETKSRFSEVSEITKDFGLRGGDMVTGTDFTSSTLKNQKGVIAIKQKEQKNGFENEAQSNIAKITNSSITNAEIEFSSPSESFEYDMISAFSDSLRFDIEFKDYEQVREELHQSTETWKSRIILTIGDKATRLGAIPTIVVKGFPNDVLKSLKELGDSRKISLLSSEDYEQVIPNQICTRLIHSREFYEEGRYLPPGAFYASEEEE